MLLVGDDPPSVARLPASGTRRPPVRTTGGLFGIWAVFMELVVVAGTLAPLRADHVRPQVYPGNVKILMTGAEAVLCVLVMSIIAVVTHGLG